MIFKTIVACVFALAVSTFASAADTTVLPATFVPEGDVLACPSEGETVEFVSALLTHDFAWISESACSVLPKNDLIVHNLAVHVDIEMETEGCDDGLCLDTFVAGVYRAVLHARYVVYIVGPDIILEPTGVKEGLQADVEYEVVPHAPPSFELFLESPPEGVAFAALSR